MKSPKPAPKGQPRLNAADLTTRGTPRKRAAGAGRPARHIPRTITLPRCSRSTHQQLSSIKASLKLKTLADAIEHAARVAHAKLKP
jgi:hypothetical protein